MTVPEEVEMEAVGTHPRLARGPRRRAVAAALADLRAAAQDGRNVMEPSIACAKAGVTTGEWGERLREIFGQYRAPTGVTPETRTDAAEREVRLMVADLAEQARRDPAPRRRQARPRRPFQRRGADCPARARRRLRRHL